MSPTVKLGPRTLPAESYAKLDTYIDSLGITRKDPRKKGFLIQILHKAQHIFGYLPEEVQKHVANRLWLHHADVSGVISFYNYFTTIPKGRSASASAWAPPVTSREPTRFWPIRKQLGIQAGGLTDDGLSLWMFCAASEPADWPLLHSSTRRSTADSSPRMFPG